MAEGRKRVAFYLRVSTGSQTVENQRRELQEVADRSGWEVVAVYQDEGVSGTKGRDRRPQFDAMLKAATRRKFDIIAAWSLDRLGRSLQDLVGFLSELRASGTDLFLHKQALDTSTVAGRAMFGMVSVFAEFEADIIKERVKAGLARARADGKRLGRRPVSEAVVARIYDQLAHGVGIIRTAKVVGCGVGTVQRVKRSMAAAFVRDDKQSAEISQAIS
jgi:DNA invertase Pin-like site-specific DNA recombinase